MRIGIDACCWSNQRGYGRFTREILKALHKIDKTNEHVFFMDLVTSAEFDLPGDCKKIVVKTSKGVTQSAGAGSYRSPVDLFEMSRAVGKENLDWFYFPSVYTYFPILNRCKIALTIHDTIAERFPQFVLPTMRDRWFWKAKVYIASLQADLVFTVSEFARNSIEEILKIPKEKMEILLEAPKSLFSEPARAVETEKILQRIGIEADEQFFLYVGGISPHKNLETLVRAFADDSLSNCKLVLVGDYEHDPFYSDYSNIQKLITEKNLNGRILLTGYLSDGDLVSLYSKSLALVLPSYYEGFGLPAVEAMAAGAPVIATKYSAIPEIAPDGALYIDPANVDSIRTAMLRLLQDIPLREKLSVLGKTYVSRLNWEASAQKLLQALTAGTKAKALESN
jgi:glycosyltransferase involved in cell wall biosynthesis